MIIGIGIDTVLVERIIHLKVPLEKFANRILTQQEITESKTKNKNIHSFVAKRFAAKEAFAKATGLGIGRGLNFNDIEVFNDKNGKPEIRIINNKEQFLFELFKTDKLKFHLSLSDEKEVATAFVVIEKIDG